MKAIILIFSITFSIYHNSYAQLSLLNYPNVTEDIADEEKVNYFLKHRITMPGVWGLGVHVKYKMNNLLYSELDLGYGWVIGDHSDAPNSFKKFRGWVDAKVGYPILDFTALNKGKWVTKTTSESEFYYNIDVPVHTTFVALAGFTSEPTNLRAYPTPNASSSRSVLYSMQAPVFTMGVKWIRFTKANVKVKQRAGTVQRLAEVYAGLVIPTKDHIVLTSEWENIQKSPSIGYDIHLSIPYRLNGFATFDIGIKSLGYNDNARLYLGNTFYL